MRCRGRGRGERLGWISVLLLGVLLMSSAAIARRDPVGDQVLRGSVVDPSDARVADAEVQLLGAQQQVVAQAQTDENGNFVLPVAGNGRAHLRITAAGFEVLDGTYPLEGLLKLRMTIAGVRYKMEVRPGAEEISTETADNANTLEVDAGSPGGAAGARSGLHRLHVRLSRYGGAGHQRPEPRGQRGRSQRGGGVPFGDPEHQDQRQSLFGAVRASRAGAPGDHDQRRYRAVPRQRELRVSRFGLRCGAGVRHQQTAGTTQIFRGQPDRSGGRRQAHDLSWVGDL